MQITKDHYLSGEQVQQLSCSKNQQKFGNGMPDTLIIHFTAGKDATSSASYLARTDVRASAHVVIARDGSIIQLVPFDTISWHAGVSSWGNRKGLNSYSIGIELDNAGVLEKHGTEYQAWFGKNYTESEVIEAVHRNEETPKYWHRFIEQQIAACEKLCALLIEKYPINTILGHEEISPGRKVDPGPAFPLDQFRSKLLKEAKPKESNQLPKTGNVIASSLNVRIGPGIEFATAGAPIPQGTPVQIINEKDGWYQIVTDKTCWVKKEYILLSESTVLK